MYTHMCVIRSIIIIILQRWQGHGVAWFLATPLPASCGARAKMMMLIMIVHYIIRSDQIIL